ncbi:porin [Cystobacter fuscus]
MKSASPPARWLVLATLLLVSSARAQDSDQQQGPSDTSPPPGGNTGAGLVLPSAFGSVELGGWLRAREAISAKEDKVLKGILSIPSARLEFTYQWKKRLKAVVEFDVTDGLKDAYASLKLVDGLAVRVGQFKVPLSLVELESTARLPVVRRGLLREVLSEDTLNLTGRRVGAQLEWQCTGCERVVRVRAGVFQNDPERASLQQGLGLVPMARATWQVLESLELGGSARAELLGTSPSGVAANWTAGLDLKHALPFGWGEWRSWAEVLVGRSSVLSGAQGRMLTGRALTAVRFGGVSKGARYVEPFAMLSVLEPDLKTRNDLLGEGVGGINVGQWRRWRLQAQVERRVAQAAVPALLSVLDDDLVTRKALLLQLEVVF